MKKNIKEQIITDLNRIVFAFIVIPYTVSIRISDFSPDWDESFSLLIQLFFTSVILGTGLFILYTIIIAVCDKSSDNLLHYENIALSRKGIDVIGIATAYTMLLYMLGLNEAYFSFALFID